MEIYAVAYAAKTAEKKKRNSFESLFITCKKLKPTQYSQTVLCL